MFPIVLVFCPITNPDMETNQCNALQFYPWRCLLEIRFKNTTSQFLLTIHFFGTLTGRTMRQNPLKQNAPPEPENYFESIESIDIKPC